MPTKGRYGITLSTPQEINFKKQCKNWIDVNEEGPKNTKIEKCDNCPSTFAQVNFNTIFYFVLIYFISFHVD
jgi:hypothetical protein